MNTKRSVQVVAVTLFILLIATLCQGQGFSSNTGFPALNQSFWGGHSNDGYFFSLGFRKYFSSFTSWQVPDIDQPQIDPISRLEYPWEQIVGVAKASYTCPLFELSLEGSSAALVWSGVQAQDSDWENPNSSGQKTTFSQGQARPRIWTFDASVAVSIPQAPCLKGIFGFRAQQFRFTYTDSIQGTIAEFDASDRFIRYLPAAQFQDLPGTVIEFGQYYRQLFLGGVLSRTFNPATLSLALSPRFLYFRFQADVATVTGMGHDEHVLRPGVGADLYTDGTGWHLNLITGLQFGHARFDVEGDFKRINTGGEIVHKATARTSSGARVWSQQAYVGINGSLRF
jgi:hypothetical protein